MMLSLLATAVTSVFLTLGQAETEISPKGLTKLLPLTSLTVDKNGGAFIPAANPGYSKTSKRFPTDRHEESNSDHPVMCSIYELGPEMSLNIASPRYPLMYVNSFTCTWEFQSLDDDELSLTCSDFKLDYKKKDYLAVKSSPYNPAKKYKKKNKPDLISSGGKLIIDFVSNNDIRAKGFFCTVKHLGVIPTTVTTTTPVPTTVVPPPLSHPSCGLLVNRITNGVEAGANELPWMVWLETFWEDGYVRNCGATIIHEEWLLTAAHCIYRYEDYEAYGPDHIQAVVGSHSLEDPGAHHGYIVDVDTNGIHGHEAMILPYDIALLRLTDPLRLSESVAPICLPLREWAVGDLTGIEVTLAGWGQTENASQSSLLRTYQTVGYNFEDCREIYGPWMNPDTQMCTDGANQTHACASDAGGPVMQTVDGRVFQIGVTSFGSSLNCTGTDPDVQIRVAFFINWIESITGLVFDI